MWRIHLLQVQHTAIVSSTYGRKPVVAPNDWGVGNPLQRSHVHLRPREKGELKDRLIYVEERQ